MSRHTHHTYAKQTTGTTTPECDTCDVVGYPAVSGLTALAHATVPLMQQANVVLRKTCPQVPGRNCSHQQQHNSQCRNHWVIYQCWTGSVLQHAYRTGYKWRYIWQPLHNLRCDRRTGKSRLYFSLTLLCGIVLVGLAVPLPYVTINVIKIVSGHIGNAVELEEVCLCGQSPEDRQQPPHEHRWRGWSEAVERRLNTASRFSSPIYLNPAVSWRPAWCGIFTPLPHGSEGGALVLCVWTAICGRLAPPVFEGFTITCLWGYIKLHYTVWNKGKWRH